MALNKPQLCTLEKGLGQVLFERDLFYQYNNVGMQDNVKKEFSINIILVTNILLMRTDVQMNGSDMSSLTVESFGSIGTGLSRKDLVLLNEIENILITRVMT